MAYITAKNLTVGYEGKAVAEHISFAVNPGDYLYIVGENGAGKSTLMKTLLHLQDKIAGEILYGDGVAAYEMSYLPQQTVVQKDFPASVWEIVLSGNLARIGRRPFYGKKEKQRAKENMEKMDIWDLRKKCYRDLSGGQQQRVLLARALCATTKLLLLDEPVSGLDPKVTAEFYQLIADLNREGVTILMVSHDMEAAATYASHILHIGREQSFFGTTKAYRESDAGSLFRAGNQEKGDLFRAAMQEAEWSDVTGSDRKVEDREAETKQ